MFEPEPADNPSDFQTEASDGNSRQSARRDTTRKNKPLAIGLHLAQLSHYEGQEFRNLFAVARDGGHGRLVPPL